MVSLLNGGVSDRNPNKRPLENGYHCSSLGNTPNYKPRKVSAFRKFPRGCGPNAQQTSPQPQQDVAVVVDQRVAPTLVVNCVRSESDDVMKSPVGVDSNGNQPDTAAVEIEADGELQVATQLCAETVTNEFKMPENQLILDVPIENVIPVVKKADRGETYAEPEIQSHEILGSPVGMIDDISLDDLVEKVVFAVGEGMDNQMKEMVSDVKPMDIELPKDMEMNSFELSEEPNGEEAQALVKQLDQPSSLVKHVGEEDVKPLSEVQVKYEAVPSPKGKFHRRRVSANRNFPPYCGTNAPSLANEESLRIISVEACLIGTEKGCVGNEELELHKESKGSAGKEIVLYEPFRAVEKRPSNDISASGHNEEPIIVNALMAAPNCPWGQQGKLASNSGAVKTLGGANKDKSLWRKNKVVAKKTIQANSSKKPSLKMNSVSVHKGADRTPDLKDEGECGEYEGTCQDLPSGCTRNVEVTLPPYGPSCSGDARNQVRETLRLFQTIYRKLLQGEEAKAISEIKRIDLEAAKIMKSKGKEIGGKKYLGAVPGIEVGDEFQYRVELAMVGVHRLYQAGIDYMKQNGTLLAISIVASGAYADDVEDADSLVYSGQGGNVLGKDKKPEDQKLERGNLALKNSITAKNPVRVIHGSKETKSSDSSDSRGKIITTYVYDGLYTVERFWPEKGKFGNQVYMFKLKRIPGQPELAWKEVKKSKKSKVRVGVCVDDISGGKESIPICAVNTINDEKPPPFSYISKMMYCDNQSHLPPCGCDCIGRCTDSGKCSCARKNGGEIPYNRNGAIVEAKPLVYECGPSCKCPPSCYNRVSQHGIKLQLEVFRTEARGWGVRSLTSIPSGTFICEYIGELLEDKEAEQRTNDEYLFDIGQNYSDCSVNPDGQGGSAERAEEVGYTIDAANYGNIGRFINHSCSPNLYAQNVLYDRDNKRMPHIMLFAAENIPALKELSYHYNYSLDQVRDSYGNIKMKSCYCGSSECTGRMY